ncbi:hypothetical protein Q2T46_11725 [Thermoanaerobacterium sp. CMT5567-10]|uniref:hypothetical protein n=1 Tax=Thermoanaerobacterium sp. CMT5567-10 TaxID=3061989 RepID=UPI0026E0CBA2|nr:hypothetical protein [Thermoanaerobacterium sp. CMT5567-10]WKV08196.1 hypothetical protein Q2T46_11725 [Thermoanaerobacterium sp. CMT5567-10]
MSMADDIRDLLERKKAATYALLENWAGTLEGYAKENASWTDRTGHARQGLNGGVDVDGNRFILYLSHSVKYGQYLEEGTGEYGPKGEPIVIKPINKKALYWEGAPHPVKIVHNPGMKARAIIGPTFDANIKRIGDSLDELWSDK